MINPAENGIVAIPQDKLEQVLEMLPRLVKADERVVEEVRGGMAVGEAFKKYRG